MLRAFYYLLCFITTLELGALIRIGINGIISSSQTGIGKYIILLFIALIILIFINPNESNNFKDDEEEDKE